MESFMYDQQQYELIRRPLRQAGPLPAWCYTDADWYERELETIFRKEWLCVGRVEQIPNTGDYFSIEVIKQPLIVVRDGDAVRVHLGLLGRDAAPPHQLGHDRVVLGDLRQRRAAPQVGARVAHVDDVQAPAAQHRRGHRGAHPALVGVLAGHAAAGHGGPLRLGSGRRQLRRALRPRHRQQCRAALAGGVGPRRQDAFPVRCRSDQWIRPGGSAWSRHADMVDRIAAPAGPLCALA